MRVLLIIAAAWCLFIGGILADAYANRAELNVGIIVVAGAIIIAVTAATAYLVTYIVEESRD